MVPRQRTSDEVLKEMWEYQSLDLGRHYLSDVAWDTSRDSAVTVKHADGTWHVCIDGSFYGEPFPDRMSACQAGHLLIATEKDVHARAVVRHNVPTDMWERGSSATQFRHKHNRDLAMYYSGGIWFVILGQYPLGRYESASDATSFLRESPPIDPDLIRLLEAIYPRSAGYPCYGRDMDYITSIEKLGLISLTVGEVYGNLPLAFLTDKGRAAMDSDSRGLSLSLRDIIFTDAQNDIQRLEWNRYFGVGGFEENGRNLQEALVSGLELHMDIVESDPKEICIKANGTYKNGHSVRDLTIMLFCPHWSEPNLVESATALINSILDHHDVLIAEAQRLDSATTA